MPGGNAKGLLGIASKLMTENLTNQIDSNILLFIENILGVLIG